MNNRLTAKWAVTLGRIGNLPASGTVASLITLVLIAVIAYSQNLFAYLLSDFTQQMLMYGEQHSFLK